jgi:hypothetical protein
VCGKQHNNALVSRFIHFFPIFKTVSILGITGFMDCPSSGIADNEKTMFLKRDLFSSSDDRRDIPTLLCPQPSYCIGTILFQLCQVT